MGVDGMTQLPTNRAIGSGDPPNDVNELARVHNKIEAAIDTATFGQSIRRASSGASFEAFFPGAVGEITAMQYVSKAGADTNNGLSVALAKLTIQAAVNALPAGGGQVVVFPGTYEGNYVPLVANSGYVALLQIGNKVTIRAAAGLHSVIIKLQNSATAAVGASPWLVLNKALSGGDTDCRLIDLVFDGNAGNQTLLTHGVGFLRVTRPVCENVWVQNCRGTSGTPPNETFHFEFQLSSEFSCVGCYSVSIGTIATNNNYTASGFSANNSTNGVFDRCVAYGMTVAHGFTHNACRNIIHVACRSYKNTGIGFNSEVSDTVKYIGCLSGGKAGIASWPFADNEVLGNINNGFVMNGTRNFELNGCSSSYNTGNGVYFQEGGARTVTDGIAANGSVTVTSATAAFTDADIGSQITDSVNYVIPGSVIVKRNSATSVDVDIPAGQGSAGLTLTIRRSPTGRILGGEYSFNAGLGFSLADYVSQVVTISGSPVMYNNTSGPIYHSAGGIYPIPGRAAGAPAVPASNTYISNSFSCTVVVYLVGGTYTAIYLDANADFGPVRTFTLRPNQRVAITYSVAPTWQWELIQ